MNWFLSFVTAFVLIFAVPVVNNYDEVLIIIDDVKNAIVKEVSTSELFSQLKSIYSFGSMEDETSSSVPDVVFDINYSGDVSKAIEKAVNEEVESDKMSKKDKIALLQKIHKNFKESISPERMLELSAEVYPAKGEVYTIISKYYPVKTGNVEGWNLVCKYPKNGGATENGTSISLWVNSLDNETYCISIAGTDSFTEIATQYIPMETNPNYSSQQREISNFCKNIKNHIKGSSIYSKCGKVKKIFVTGHSMGGFYSMWLGTDLYDSNSYCLTKRSDISQYLTKENIKSYTFAAPGLLTSIPSNLPKTIKVFLKVGDQIPEWSRQKLNNNKNKLYDSMLYQYTNSRDIVPNLNNIFEFLSDSIIKKDWVKLNFEHMGNHYQFTSDKMTMSEWRASIDKFDTEGAWVSSLNSAAYLAQLTYHLHHYYLTGFTKTDGTGYKNVELAYL